MKIKIIEKLLDKRDTKKRIKALQVYPWQYEDRYGRIWFNTDYWVSHDKLRKWC